VYILTKDSIVDEEREPLGFDVRTKLTFDFVHHPREVAFHIYQRLRDLEEEERVRQQARLDESILEILKLYNEEVIEKRLPPSASQAT